MNLFKKVVATAALITMVSSMTPSVGAYSTAALDAANALAADNIISTKATPAEYRLDQNVLRQEIAAVVRGVAGIEKATTCVPTFSDVTANTPNTWAWASINPLAAAGLIAKNPTFRPEASISKAEAVGMVVKAACGTDYAYDATKGTSWQEQVVSYASANGVTSAFTDYNTSATRGFVFEAAVSAMDSCGEAEDDVLCELLGTCEDDTTEETPANTGSTNTGTIVSPVVTGGEVEASLSPESPVGTIAAGSSRTSVMAVDFTAWENDVTLKETTLKFVGSGDATLFDDLAIYLNNTKITKQDSKKFDDENEAVLTFDKNLVVKAWETQTLVVTTTLSGTAASTNQAMQVAMTELVSSASSVEGLTVVGNVLTPVSVSNKAAVTITNNKASETVTVGTQAKIAGFYLEETSKKEDVVVKSVSFTVSGSIDAEDDLSDLVLYADGKEIASDLYVNGDDEIVADLDYTIAADDKVKFELKGTVTGSIGETIELVFDDADDVYVIGKTTGVSLAITNVTSTDLATAKTIEGSEINVSFDKSSIDEAKPNAEGVLIGTVKLTAANDYTIDELKVTASGIGAAAIDSLELDGSAYDSKSGNVYTFKDISISAGETLTLPLTMDVVDNTIHNGTSVVFDLSITKVTDEENDNTYPADGALSTVLSSTTFNTKTIDIESASFTLNQTSVSERELVLGNGIEVVLYKGKVSVGDADSVTINDLNFTGDIDSTGAYDFKDILDSATLNIGGKTFDWDIETDGIDFTSISEVVAAGSDNVELTLTAVLKDNDSVNNNDEIIFSLADSDLEDSDWEALETANVDVNNVAATNNVVLNEEGTFTLNVVANGDYKDSVVSNVLAGASSVALAELEIEAEDEDVKVKELVLTISGATDFSSTLNNVKLVNAATNAVIADGAVVTHLAGTGTVITFKDDFVIADSSNEIKALLVADLSKYTDKGGSVSAATWDVVVKYSSIDLTGVSSNEDIDNTPTSFYGETVAIVPALVTVSIVDEIGSNDKDAIIRFTVDKGTNDFTDDSIYFTGMTLESAVASGVIIRNDDDATITLNGATSTAITVAAANTTDTEIFNNDEFTIKVENDGDEVRIVAKGIKYTIGAGTTAYSVVNDKVINLGEYDSN